MRKRAIAAETSFGNIYVILATKRLGRCTTKSASIASPVASPSRHRRGGRCLAGRLPRSADEHEPFYMPIPNFNNSCCQQNRPAMQAPPHAMHAHKYCWIMCPQAFMSSRKYMYSSQILLLPNCLALADN